MSLTAGVANRVLLAIRLPVAIVMTPSMPKDNPPPQGTEAEDTSKHIEIPFTEVIHDFEWIDAHFLLPDFDIPEVAWHPGSQAWLDLPWYIPDGACCDLWIYFDGSHFKESGRSGAGVTAFASTTSGWCYCGSISTELAEGIDSYQAEANAALVAIKFAYDLLKLATAHGGGTPSTHLVFDNTSVGQQTVGTWGMSLSS